MKTDRNDAKNLEGILNNVQAMNAGINELPEDLCEDMEALKDGWRKSELGSNDGQDWDSGGITRDLGRTQIGTVMKDSADTTRTTRRLSEGRAKTGFKPNALLGGTNCK